MPIISVGIVNKQGKIILSRQFVDIARIRIEGLLSALPRLLTAASTPTPTSTTGPSSESTSTSKSSLAAPTTMTTTTKQQCTFIETGSVRYVYQPLEDLLLVILTTKSSNIVEDLSTLRMVGRLVPEYVPNITEESVSAKAFDLLFALDEVVVGGHRENCTLEQVMTYLEMQSHEEEVAREEKKRQIDLAKKEAKKREAELSKKRREQAFGGIGNSNISGGRAPSDDHPNNNNDGSSNPNSSSQPAVNKFCDVAEEVNVTKNKTNDSKSTSGGMSLGKARRQDAAAKVLLESGVTTQLPPVSATSQQQPPTSSNQLLNNQGAIHIKIDEKISASLNRDGGANNVDVRGDLFILVSDASYSSIRLLLQRFNDVDFSFKTHPHINKGLLNTDRVLAIKDNKPYPTHQSLGIVRWRLQTPGKIKAPLSVNCWPSESGATVEFELENNQAVLQDVVISIPFPSSAKVVGMTSTCSIGTFSVQNGMLHWAVPQVDKSTSSGSLEFQMEAANPNAFFPMKVSFHSSISLAGVQVAEVVSTETGLAAPFTAEVVLSAEDYQVN